MNRNTQQENLESDLLTWSEKLLRDRGIDEDEFSTLTVHKYLRDVLLMIAVDDLRPRIKKAVGWYKEKNSKFAAVLGVSAGNLTRWLSSEKYGSISLSHYLSFLLYFRDVVPPHGHDAWIRQVAVGLLQQIRANHLCDDPGRSFGSLSERDFAAIHLFFAHVPDFEFFSNPDGVPEDEFAQLMASVEVRLEERHGTMPYERKQLRTLIGDWNQAYSLWRFAFESYRTWDFF